MADTQSQNTPAEQTVALDSSARAPLLSVTVLNYNYGRYLKECLDSILGQTMADFELILINDCSTDDSLSVIEPYLLDPRVRLIDHEVNKGYVSSLVEGCDLSRGKYMSVISADDYVLNLSAFDVATATMEKSDEVSLCYSAWHQVDNLGNVGHSRRGGTSDYVRAGEEELLRMLVTSPVLHSGAMIRRSAYAEVGGYDARLRYSVDTNMWLALCSVGKVAYIDQPLYIYRAHDTNMTNSSGAMWTATEEMLVGIDVALERFKNIDPASKKRLRRRAWQNALVAIPTMDIFSGRIARGWHGFWLAFRHYPLLTLFQSRLLSLLARTILGRKRYEALMRFVVRRNSKDLVELEANFNNA